MKLKMNSKMKMLSTTALLAITAAGLFAQAAASLANDEKTLIAESGKVEFLAIGFPSFIKVRGEGPVPLGKMTVANGKTNGEFKINLAAFKTGIERRDEHMRTALEVDKFPTAFIRFKDIEIKEGTTKATIPAELELHGQKKPVSLEAELTAGKATGKMNIKLSEFGITPPNFASITVKDGIDITIEAALK